MQYEILFNLTVLNGNGYGIHSDISCLMLLYFFILFQLDISLK